MKIDRNAMQQLIDLPRGDIASWCSARGIAEDAIEPIAHKLGRDGISAASAIEGFRLGFDTGRAKDDESHRRTLSIYSVSMGRACTEGAVDRPILTVSSNPKPILYERVPPRRWFGADGVLVTGLVRGDGVRIVLKRKGVTHRNCRYCRPPFGTKEC